MLSKWNSLLLESLKSLSREKVNFYISSIIISICIVSIFLIYILGFRLVNKIKAIEDPHLVVTYKNLYKECDSCPIKEYFDDIGNGIWDEGEYYEDDNNNGQWDEGEYYSDESNGIWDPAEEFRDSNSNGIWDFGEEFVDSNNNGIWDPEENFSDIGNNKWDIGELYWDFNNNGQWDEGEDFEDKGNGICDFLPNTCPECDIYDSTFLAPLDSDSESELKGKEECRECIENTLGMADGECFLDSDKILGCESYCKAPSGSKYQLYNYEKGEYFDDINRDQVWSEGLEPFINNRYYGSRKKTECGGCIHFKYLDASNRIMRIDGISKEIKTRDKDSIIVIFERDYGINYFEGRPDRFYIDVPIVSYFKISKDVNTKESIDSLINKVTNIQYVKDIDKEKMLDYPTILSYKRLSQVIVSSIPFIIFFILLVPFFIVSNTTHLIIYSKRDTLNTLRLLGERDFYIKLPFVFQGVWQGLVGALFAILLIFILDVIGLGDIINNIINELINQSKPIIDSSLVSSLNHALTILFLGIFLGIFGALRAVSRYLK